MITLGDLLAFKTPPPPREERRSQPDLGYAPDPDPDPDPGSSPCRKRAHETGADAEAQRQSLLQRPDCESPNTLVVYRCATCRLWHVGHDRRETITIPGRT